jgi:hypothetical protein
MNWKYAVGVSAILATVTSSYSQRVSPEVERVASAMFQHFETVSYTKTDFLVDYERAHNSRTVLSSEADHHTYAPSEDHLILPFTVLLAALQSLGPEAAMHFENGFDEVMGGANFPAPQDLGKADSTSCYVGIAKHGGSPDMASTISVDDRMLPRAGTDKPITVKAPRKEILGGTDITQWSWMVPVSRGWMKQFYAMQIGDDFAICDDQVEIVELMKTLTSSPFALANSASPYVRRRPKAEDYWKTISTHAYWSYRALDAQTAAAIAAQVAMPASTTSLAVYADPSDQGGEPKITSGDSKKPPRALNDPGSLYTAVAALGFGVRM